MRSPYLLYKRGKYWYAHYWVEDDYDYSLRRSTGKTSKAAADLVAREWLEEGLRPKSQATLADYLKAFWASSGAYATAQEARGRKLSTKYLDGNARRIEAHVLPLLEHWGKLDTSLSATKTSLIEAIQMELHANSGLTPRTVNSIMQAVIVPLSEAERLGLIKSNPGRKVGKLAERSVRRTIFTLEEVRAFFALPWPDPRQLGINMLAATTGMRLGECLGLRAEDVRGDHIHVCHNWQGSEGLKAPKWGSVRDVPLPARTGEMIASLVEANPFQDGYVFWGATCDKPMTKELVNKRFAEACSALGIKDRMARGLSFHAWRHWYNSMLRGKVPDHALRALTGHRSEEMTERYSHISEEQMEAVAGIADQLRGPTT